MGRKNTKEKERTYPDTCDGRGPRVEEIIAKGQMRLTASSKPTSDVLQDIRYQTSAMETPITLVQCWMMDGRSSQPEGGGEITPDRAWASDAFTQRDALTA